MRQPLLCLSATLFACTIPLSGYAPAEAEAPAVPSLEKAIASPSRAPANVVRDRYRHPLETLNFFGLGPNQTVVELWPGGGWYTEILAPYVRQTGGTYHAVAPERGLAGVRKLMADAPDLYGHSHPSPFVPGAAAPPVPAGSADIVLTFRNVHNWMMGDTPIAGEVFRQIHAMLKPGGILGVVDHRLPENADPARERTSGYVKTSTVVRLAEAAGFRLLESSEINANPKDSADWPGGVWTLPPALRGDPENRDKYLAIGESDRMTLKFVKPE